MTQKRRIVKTEFTQNGRCRKSNPAFKTGAGGSAMHIWPAGPKLTARMAPESTWQIFCAAAGETNPERMSHKEEHNHKEEETLNPQEEAQNQASPEDKQAAEQKSPEEQDTAAPKNEQAEAPESSPEETTDQEDSEKENLEKQVQELKDKHLRTFAEFENYKKRTAKERVEMLDSANQDLMTALLPVVDDFERALENMEEEAAEGVRLIYNKLVHTLKQKGLEPMESAKEKEFDLDTMEAITRIPAPEEELKGKVLDEIEKGYYLGKKIIRYAKVVVGE